MAMGTTSILYNPFLPIFLTREIWSLLNVVSAALFVGHLCALRQLVNDHLAGGVPNIQRERLKGERERRSKGSQVFWTAFLKLRLILRADIKSRNKDGYRLLDQAAMSRSPAYTRALIAAGADVTHGLVMLNNT